MIGENLIKALGVFLLFVFSSFTVDTTEIYGKWVIAKERTQEELLKFKQEKGVSDEEIHQLLVQIDSIGMYFLFKEDLSCEMLFVEAPRYGTYTYNDTAVYLKVGANNVAIDLQLNQEKSELLFYPGGLFPLVFKKE